MLKFGTMAAGAVSLAIAVGCYAVSIKVSGERKAVEDLRGRIVADMRGIRMLQAELRTRARLPELQRWNDEVLALSAPAAAQLVRDPVQLASFAADAPQLAEAQAAGSPVVEAPAARFAIAEAPAPAPSPVRTVSYATPRAVVAPPRATPPATLPTMPVERAAPVVQTAAVSSTVHTPAAAKRAAKLVDAKPVTVAAGLGLDAAMGGAIDAAASAERAGLTKFALR